MSGATLNASELVSSVDALVKTATSNLMVVRDSMGGSVLPEVLVNILKAGEGEHPSEDVERQVGRVAANLVVDHAGYIEAALSASAFRDVNRKGVTPALQALVASFHNLVVDGHSTGLETSAESIARTCAAAVSMWLPLGRTAASSEESAEVESLLHFLSSACSIFGTCFSVDVPPVDALRSAVTSADKSPAVEVMLDFVEYGSFPSQWKEAMEEEGSDEEETLDCGKIFGTAKADIIKALVAISCGFKDGAAPCPYWSRMKSWLGKDIAERNDLVDCALLSYGNSIQDDCKAVALLNGESSILPVITRLLDPSTPATTQHSVIGLVRNLSISLRNKVTLTQAGVLDKLMEMKVWSSERDSLGSIQGGVISIVKNLCRDDPDNSEHFVANYKEPLLDLLGRSEDPAMRFEGTRVFVNVIKSLSRTGLTDLADERIVRLLVTMLRDGSQYVILQNEAIIALSLLATFGPESTGELAHLRRELMSDALVKLNLEDDHGESESGLQVLQRMCDGEDSTRQEIRHNAETLMNKL
ncbi:hypothetical protein CI109_104225 [Kwoniella shandongensis]|uniref:Uncharacterized protein n=1 Tax=Kwoniella shandongensis TaxID=1734106 RepID=A0AAJ8LM73_9TREE